MDNLTHALTGALIARTLPARWSGEPDSPSTFDPEGERPGRWVLWSSVIAANLPDFEALILWPPPLGDKAAYLLHHRGWSHSLVGIAGEALLFAGLLWVFHRHTSPERKLRPTSAASRTSSRPVTGTCRTAGARAPGSRGGFFAGFTPLRGLTVAGLGAGSHLFLDWWNSYGVRPFYPWDKSWYYGDLVFIVDPWVWLALGGALVCGTRRFGRAKWGWYALTAAATLVVFEACRRGVCPWWVLIGWTTGVIEIALLRWWGVWRAARWIGWGMIGGYLAAMAWGTSIAFHEIPASSGSLADDHIYFPKAALPVAGTPWERQTFANRLDWFHAKAPDRKWDETFLARETERVSLLAPLVPASAAMPPRTFKFTLSFLIAAEHAVDANAHRPAVVAWRSFARFPEARVQLEPGTPLISALILGDARYERFNFADPANPSDWTALAVLVSPPVQVQDRPAQHWQPKEVLEFAEAY